jgi:S1-C subfamily serine protease
MNRNFRWIIVAMLVVVVLTIPGCAFPFSKPDLLSGQSVPSGEGDVSPTAAPALSADLYPEEVTLAGLYQRVNPSVVNIHVVSQRSGVSDMSMPQYPNPQPMPQVPNMPNQMPQQGEGSGFVWDAQGHVLTNHHVVKDASSIEVTFADDTRVDAKLVGSDPHSDLAVIRVDPNETGLYPVTLGDSDTLVVGQFAIAIGNPFGQVGTMTRGIISALGRTFRASDSQFSITEMIQTDASINPGNSGGPLLDSRGRVIGINTLILSQTGSSAGVGFAIPVNTAKRIVPDLIQTGKHEYALLGVVGTDLSPSVAKAMGLPAKSRGAVITEISPNGPAARAGLQPSTTQVEIDGIPTKIGGDVITAIDGQPMTKMADVLDFLANEVRPNQTISLTIARDGQEMIVEVKLGSRPAELHPMR